MMMNASLFLVLALCVEFFATSLTAVTALDGSCPVSSSSSSYSCGCGHESIVPERREVYDDGRIIDISHRMTPEMPTWGSDEGLGQFLSLPASMKNGSLANNSEMKLPTHTGTHVDAPGHVYDHYFDAGFDVDTLDLALLNVTLLVLLQLLTGAHHNRAHKDACPSGYGEDFDSCVKADGELVPFRREVYAGGRIIDITHRYTRDTAGGGPDGIGEYVWLTMSMSNGSDYNYSIMKLPVHSGTHVDAPGHMYNDYFKEGFDVDTLDLDVLNGPALLVDVPRDKNITAEVMKSLHIPKGIRRVLFRTLNTERKLMYKRGFDTTYVGFMKDGAQWLVDNTDIQLVGIDYLSVAAYDDLIPSHLVFLKSREIILVEGLKLDGVKAGLYTVHCLPLRLFGAEGSPIRCILMK